MIRHEEYKKKRKKRSRQGLKWEWMVFCCFIETRNVVWQVGVRVEMQQALTRRTRKDGMGAGVVFVCGGPDCLQGCAESSCGT
jgi:hypothetical protein